MPRARERGAQLGRRPRPATAPARPARAGTRSTWVTGVDARRRRSRSAPQQRRAGRDPVGRRARRLSVRSRPHSRTVCDRTVRVPCVGCDAAVGWLDAHGTVRLGEEDRWSCRWRPAPSPSTRCSRSAARSTSTPRPRLRERLIELVDGGAPHVVVDLGRVEFLDSTGLGVLVGALKRLRAAGGTFGLVCAKEPLLKIFRITALDQVFPLYPTVEAATSTRTERDGSGPTA